mgnify:CR=1 FL=1
MEEVEERLWSFSEVRQGQSGAATAVTLTAADIAEYAAISRNDAPRYHPAENASALAMPTMILSYAPLMRESIANANGFTAYEQSRAARRQTPFTKCEIRWHAPVRSGDTLTASREVHEKYTRRGSNFVTFRVSAKNQLGVTVGGYDYTCIFDYAKGQPRDSSPRQSIDISTESSTNDIDGADFDAIHVGAALGTKTVTETQDDMNAKDAFRLVGERGVGSNIHTDEDFARKSIFGTTVNSGPATMAYVSAFLEQCFPAESFYAGGRLSMRAITPFKAGDTVTFTGSVAGKRAGHLVDCKVEGRNQHGGLVCLAEATLAL